MEISFSATSEATESGLSTNTTVCARPISASMRAHRIIGTAATKVAAIALANKIVRIEEHAADQANRAKHFRGHVAPSVGFGRSVKRSGRIIIHSSVPSDYVIRRDASRSEARTSLPSP